MAFFISPADSPSPLLFSPLISVFISFQLLASIFHFSSAAIDTGFRHYTAIYIFITPRHYQLSFLFAVSQLRPAFITISLCQPISLPEHFFISFI